MATFQLRRGNQPLLISMPHQGTEIPAPMKASLTPAALQLEDTDWHLKRLYEFAGGLGASIIWPRYSRYVIDLNRPPDNSSLYPGVNGTELCPTASFSSAPLYLPGREPDPAEIASRLDVYWHPYHGALQAELARIREEFGVAVLFEAHSIRSRVPRLFEGRLPDLNIGTNDGVSCSADMEAVARRGLEGQRDYTWVVNQRFKGGYITRAYGNPEDAVHSIQLEISQCCYMEETPPFTYLPPKAIRLQTVLKSLLGALLAWAQPH